MPRFAKDADRPMALGDAAQLVAHRQGPLAVSLRTVAEQIGVSLATVRRIVDDADASPLRLALEFLAATRGGTDGATVPSAGPAARCRAADALRHWLPSHPENVQEEHAWRSIVGACGHDPHVAALEDVRCDALARCAQSVARAFVAASEPCASEAVRLCCLVEGAVIGTCEGRLGLAEAEELIERHLASLEGAPDPQT